MKWKQPFILIFKAEWSRPAEELPPFVAEATLDCPGSAERGLLAVGAFGDLLAGTGFLRLMSVLGAGPSTLGSVMLGSSCDLLIREFFQPRVPTRMLDGHADEISLAVKINVNILADRLGLDHVALCELDQGRISVRKVFNFHSPVSLKALSKKAL
jgi:hypothetical protein